MLKNSKNNMDNETYYFDMLCSEVVVIKVFLFTCDFEIIYFGFHSLSLISNLYAVIPRFYREASSLRFISKFISSSA